MPTWPRSQRQSVKIAGQTGEKSEQGFAARKDSGLLPELNKAHRRAQGRRQRWRDLARSTSRRTPPERRHRAEAQPAPQSIWKLILDNLWPLAKAAITETIPLTIISFVIGLVIALWWRLARLSTNVVALQHRPVLHLDHPRHPAAGAVVHHLLRAAAVRGEVRSVPGCDHRVLASTSADTRQRSSARRSRAFRRDSGRRPRRSA